MDYLGLEVVGPLVAKLREVLDDPSLAEPDDPAADEVPVAADVLCVLCEAFDAAPPEPALVEACAGTYLRVWDGYIDQLRPERTLQAEWEAYKRDRRGVIRASFERLLGLARTGHQANA